MRILRNLKRDPCRRSEMLFLVCLALAFSFGYVFAQQPQIVYIYDDLGRLVRVITETGDAATYHYDAVGNLLRITRDTGVSATASVINVAPNSGVRGASFPISISGLNLAGANLITSVAGITFSNVRTTLDQIVADITINTTVPTGTTQIVVETQFGTIPTSFTVTDTAPSVLILSPAEGVTTMEGVQLTLSAQAADNVQVTQVVWSLNGVAETPVFTPPYQKVVKVPVNITTLSIAATATDSVGQTSTATKTITVQPDPPPTVVITSPPAGSTAEEGTQLALAAQATDNVEVRQFTWTVNGVEQNSNFTPPYERVVTVPIGLSSLTIVGAAIDNLGRTGTATRTITVTATPRTTVIGRVITSAGQAIAGATVRAFSQYISQSQTDGTFSISQVPTVLGPITVTAEVQQGTSTLTGVSASVPAVANAITNVGDVTIASGAVADLYPGPRIAIDAAAYLAVVDLNGDGILDIAAPNISSNEVFVFLGIGNGIFQTEQRFATGNSPWSIAVGDLNADGIKDIVTTNTASDDISVLLGNGNGTFQAHQRLTTGTVPWWVAVADLNGDAIPDIVTVNSDADDVSVLLGNGGGTFQPQQRIPAGVDPSSVAVADLNGDGFQDLAVANNFSDDISVLLGNGNGAFQAEQRFFAGGHSISIAIADVNGDGNQDVVVAIQESNFVSVLLGNGNGTFQSQQSVLVGTAPQFVAVADVNEDGFSDLVTSGPFNYVLVLSFGNGEGSVQPQPAPPSFAVGTFPLSIAVGELNSDGFPDVVTANRTSGDVSVLLGNGNGTFQPQQRASTGSSPQSTAIADLNGDGFRDLVVANGGTNDVSILLGNGDGTFQTQQRFAAGSFPNSMAIADLNGDDVPDLAVLSSSAVAVLRGNGNGTFQAEQRFTAGFGSRSVKVVDVNGDSFLDLLTANRVTGDFSVLLGNGAGNFQSHQRFVAGNDPRSMAVLDVNGDGKPDVITANGNLNAVSVIIHR